MGGRARAYGANKRRKELARKAKQEEKRRRRLDRSKAGPGSEGSAPAAGPPIAEAPEPIS